MTPKDFAHSTWRSQIQMVFQDPTDGLNPRFTAARAIAGPIMQLGDIKGNKALRMRCEELALEVGLPLELLDRFPHQLSGGQKARVGISQKDWIASSTSFLEDEERRFLQQRRVAI